MPKQIIIDDEWRIETDTGAVYHTPCGLAMRGSLTYGFVSFTYHLMKGWPWSNYCKVCSKVMHSEIVDKIKFLYQGHYDE